MKIHIQHHTTYSYTWPVLYSIQHVRLTPVHSATQQVLTWRVKAPAKTSRSTDHFQNTVHTFTVNHAHNVLHVESSGEVELLHSPSAYQPKLKESIHPLVYCNATALTEYNEEMQQFASHVSNSHLPFADRLLALAHAVADRVVYTKGSTTVSHTAQHAFDHGLGVCQDHAHVMLACLRSHGIAARYVSGYFFNPDAPRHESHAWIEAFDPACELWLGVDATHRALAQQQHCKVAVGKDYTGASPVRGVRSGGGDESLEVKVTIHRVN
ncbi:MAG TPA: transglutaminase family protein [Limnobacter sp.]|nr:transglutaminase family protein [Limnobacter sp.]